MWTRKWILSQPNEEGAEGGAPVVQESVSAPDDSKLWDDLLEDDVAEVDEVEEDAQEATPEVEVGGEAEKTEEVAVAVEAPKPAVAEVAPVVEKPEEVVAPTPAPVVSQAPVEQPPPQEIGPADRELLRQRAMAALVERYALPEEDAVALQVEPEKVLPKLAANLHAAIYQDVLQRVVTEAPALIERTLTQRTETQKAEEAFYERWGNLRDRPVEVQRVAAMWRQMYPNASLAEAIEGIGTAASALLGLSQQTPAVAVAPATPPPPPPAGPSSRVGISPPSKSRLSAEEQTFVDLANTFVEDY